MRNISVGHRILAWWEFPLSAWTMTFHCLLTAFVHSGKSVPILVFHSVHCAIFLWLLSRFYFYSWHSVFFIVSNLPLIFLDLSCFGLIETLLIICFPPNLRNFWQLFFLTTFPLLFFLLGFQLLTNHRYKYDIFPQVTKALYCF